MISLSKLLNESSRMLEKTGEEMIASKVAKNLGLVYKGFGRWADPKTNKIVAKTIDDKLVRVEPTDIEDTEPYHKWTDKGTYEKNPNNKLDSWGAMTKMGQKLDAPLPAKDAMQQKFLSRVVNSEGKLTPEQNATAVKSSTVLASKFAKERGIKLGPDIQQNLEMARQNPQEYDAFDMGRLAKFLGEVPTNDRGEIELNYSVDTGRTSPGRSYYDPPEPIDYEGSDTFKEVTYDLVDKLKWNEKGEWEYSPDVPDNDYDSDY